MLDQPSGDRRMRSALTKKEFHFAPTAEHLAQVVWAETIAEAETSSPFLCREMGWSYETDRPQPQAFIHADGADVGAGGK